MTSFNPILIDFPDSFETERLIVRGARAGDSALLHPAIVESETELAPWMPWANPVQTQEETELVVRRMAARWILREEFMLLIFRKYGDDFLGSAGVHHVDWDVPKFEIGYWLRTSATGQGYATEAIAGLCDFCRTSFGARRLEIRCDASNLRSAAVAERAGFALEARRLSDRRDAQHRLADTLLFVRLLEE